jgi:hypothetical protein
VTPAQGDSFTGTQTLPDQVTLQPTFRTWRTPFSYYKVARGDAESDINPSKLAARRLGISETEFEDSLTREINDLLSEIEIVRFEALRCTNDDLASSNTPGATEERRGASDPLQQNKDVELKGLRPGLSTQGIQSAHLTEGLNPTDTLQPLEWTGRPPKLTPGSRAKRGREEFVPPLHRDATPHLPRHHVVRLLPLTVMNKGNRLLMKGSSMGRGSQSRCGPRRPTTPQYKLKRIRSAFFQIGPRFSTSRLRNALHLHAI